MGGGEVVLWVKYQVTCGGIKEQASLSPPPGFVSLRVETDTDTPATYFNH